MTGSARGFGVAAVHELHAEADEDGADEDEQRAPPQEAEREEDEAGNGDRSQSDRLIAAPGRGVVHVFVYSGPDPPSGGVSRPPFAVIAPHCTQFDGVTCTSTVPSAPGSAS